jgi:hypothetical protein
LAQRIGLLRSGARHRRGGLVADRGVRPAGIVVGGPDGKFLAGVVEAEERFSFNSSSRISTLERWEDPNDETGLRRRFHEQERLDVSCGVEPLVVKI